MYIRLPLYLIQLKMADVWKILIRKKKSKENKIKKWKEKEHAL